jgi:hypothetical protein
MRDLQYDGCEEMFRMFSLVTNFKYARLAKIVLIIYILLFVYLRRAYSYAVKTGQQMHTLSINIYFVVISPLHVSVVFVYHII